jgi:hypothetical protein
VTVERTTVLGYLPAAPATATRWSAPGRVEQDLRGYITPEGATRDYGCVVGPDGRIDLPATAALRAQRRARRA